MDNRDPKSRNVGSKPTTTNESGRVEQNYVPPRNTGTNPPNPPRRQSETEMERGIYRAQEQASSVGNKVQAQAQNVMDTAQEQARSTLTTQKGRAADSLHSVARAIRHTGDQLRNENQDAIAGVADRVADQIESFSDTLQNRNVDEMVDDTERYARQHPEVFIGGAFVLGILAARFLKSSARSGVNDMNRTGMGMHTGSNYPLTPGYTSTTPTPRTTTTPDVTPDEGPTFTT